VKRSLGNGDWLADCRLKSGCVSARANAGVSSMIATSTTRLRRTNEYFSVRVVCMAVGIPPGELQRVTKTLDLQESLVNGCDQEFLDGCWLSGKSQRIFISTYFIRCEFNPLFVPPWPLHQLPAAIRTDILRLRRAFFAESAFVRANHRHPICRQCLMAFFALLPHLQRHATPLTNMDVNQVRAPELRHVARFFPCNRQQPGGKRFVPLHRQTGHISDDAFKFMQ